MDMETATCFVCAALIAFLCVMRCYPMSVPREVVRYVIARHVKASVRDTVWVDAYRSKLKRVNGSL